MARSDSLGMFWFDEPVAKPPKKEKPKKTPPEPVWERDDYLPGFEQALTANYPILSDNDLVTMAWPYKTELYFDIECYRNYFLIAFKEPKSGKYLLFEIFENEVLDSTKLRWVMENFTLIGFNSQRYDIPMATLACHPMLATPNTLKTASDMIIQQEFRPSDIYREFKVRPFPVDHIDIIEVLPLDGSLKVYSGRIHAPKLQDLPFHPEKLLTREQKIITRHYCTNDLLDTVLLTDTVREKIDLRRKLGERYEVDLRSKSDAQIAESVIRKRVEQRKGYRVKNAELVIGQSFKYNAPTYLQFRTPMMQSVMYVVTSCNFVVGETGRIGLPEDITRLNIQIGNSHYQMGIGGLHSKEKCAAYKAQHGTIIRDRDVTSYYPRIILNQRLAPENLGSDFLVEFNSIVEERITAKHNKDKVTSESLKITINGSFGKFGSKYSVMYSPQLVIQVTVTGQLSLLLLIEMLELAGITVVSGNTDGIVIYTTADKESLLNQIVAYWESVTGFETEETIYSAIYSRDVNNYIAIKPDLEVKLKGAYRTKDLSKNPVNEICVDAVVAYLTVGRDIISTVTTCDDIRKFLTLRVVKGGAFKDGEFIGKTVRWYKSTECPGPIIYAKSGNDVPVSNGCRPLQTIPDQFPEDVDLEWYIEQCYKILKDIGAD